ncbi:MAG: hypothetical protein FJX72_07735 [Armatimonadetes bacterium]|nr:hypothetical protein [Armatimonadota bacterium]
MSSARPKKPLRRLLVQLSEDVIRSIRVEARRRGSSSRAEEIRSLIADGFAFRRWVESTDEPNPQAQD